MTFIFIPFLSMLSLQAPHSDLVHELLQSGILVREDSNYLDASTDFDAASIIHDVWAGCGSLPL